MAVTADVCRLKAALAASRARLFRALEGVTEEQFRRRPEATAADATPWCISEVLGHLLASERLRAARIALALEQDGAAIESQPAEAHEAAARAGRRAPVPQLVHGLLASRREIERLLERATAIEDGLDRAVVHPERGRETVAWMLVETVIGHEAEHVGQIEALRRAAGAGEPRGELE